jgi:transposase
MGYNGYKFSSKIKTTFKKDLEIVARPRKYCWVPDNVTDVLSHLKDLGQEVIENFKIQPKRWIVERTFAWLGKYRRLSKDYEYNTGCSESLIYLAMTRNMLKQLVN